MFFEGIVTQRLNEINVEESTVDEPWRKISSALNEVTGKVLGYKKKEKKETNGLMRSHLRIRTTQQFEENNKSEKGKLYYENGKGQTYMLKEPERMGD